MGETIPQVYSFVHAQLYLNNYDESSLYPPFETHYDSEAGTTDIPAEYLGYRANLTTFNINQNLNRIYNLGVKVPATLKPMRFEGRATMEFIPVSLHTLNKFAELDYNDNTVLRKNLLVKLGSNKLYGLEGIVVNRLEMSVREGDVATIRADSVYRQIRELQPTDLENYQGIDATELTSAPLVFKDIKLEWNTKEYVVRELTATINTGHDVAYALGDRRYAVVWQGRQEVELTFNVYMDASSLSDFMTDTGVNVYQKDQGPTETDPTDYRGFIGEPATVTAIIEHIGDDTDKITFNDVRIHTLGIPIRVGELVMLNVTAYARTITVS